MQSNTDKADKLKQTVVRMIIENRNQAGELDSGGQLDLCVDIMALIESEKQKMLDIDIPKGVDETCFKLVVEPMRNKS